LFQLTRIPIAASKRTFLPLAFSCLGSLHLVLSLSLLARAFGLPYLVLMSTYWDWAAWVLSGNMFAWICLVSARREARWMLYSALLALAGSVLQVLPTALPVYELGLTLSRFGGILMSCAVLAGTIMYLRYSRVFSISLIRAARLLLTFSFALLIPLQVWSIATSFSFLKASRDYPQFNAILGFEKLLQLLLPATTILFVLLATQWLWFPIVSKMNAEVARLTRVLGNMDSGGDRRTDQRRRLSAGWIVPVGLSVIVGMLVSSYQWSLGYPLGQDARYYSSILHRINAIGVQSVISTERPFFFLTLYAVQKISGLETSLLLRVVPVFLATILIVGTYFFTRFVGGKENVAGFAAIFAAASFHITVGVEYFIVANWFGILVMMLFIYTFLRSVAQRSTLWMVFTIALSAYVLGVHYFTWLFMIFMIMVYFLMSVVEKRFARTADKVFCVVMVLGCVAVVVPAVLVAYGVGAGLLASLRLVEDMLGNFLKQATPLNFIAFLQDQERIYNYFGREHYAIPLLYALAIVGFAKLRCMRNDQGRLLRCWFISSCLGILVVHYNEWWRFLYLIPLEILAALGLTALLGCGAARQKSSLSMIARDGFVPVALLMFIFFSLGFLLAFSSFPSFLLFLSPVAVVFAELRCPRQNDWGEITFLLGAFLALEQLSRALYVLA